MWPVCPTFAIMKIITFFCTHVYVYSFLGHIREIFFQNCRDMNCSTESNMEQAVSLFPNVCLILTN